MSRPQSRDDYRRQMAEAFVNVLEEKGLEWRKDWHAKGTDAPHNGITKACYRGTNAFWLSLISMVKGYDDPRWVTMIQIVDRDGKYHPKEKWHLKAGSKAVYVEYWYPFDLKNKKALTWEQFRTELSNGRSETEFRLSTRYTAVFNARDVEGMPERVKSPSPTFDVDKLVHRLSENMNVPIYFDGGYAPCYSLKNDSIHLPPLPSFEDGYALNSAALHELAHSTGHPSRLGRQQTAASGSQEYAYEELVAEISACFMGADLDFPATSEHMENHKAYVQNWIQAIKDKPETLVKAIKEAQSAANYMDWKAELISEKEYAELAGKSFEMPVRSAPNRDMER